RGSRFCSIAASVAASSGTTASRPTTTRWRACGCRRCPREQPARRPSWRPKRRRSRDEPVAGREDRGPRAGGFGDSRRPTPDPRPPVSPTGYRLPAPFRQVARQAEGGHVGGSGPFEVGEEVGVNGTETGGHAVVEAGGEGCLDAAFGEGVLGDGQ